MNPRTAIDGAVRRRLYLFRHGAVDYINPDGSWVDKPDLVSLNERGRVQAAAMAELFRDVQVDAAMCSPLPRTRQTGEAILGNRDVKLKVVEALGEIRPITGQAAGGYDIVSDVAFSHWRAHQADARFLGGERYHDFYARVSAAMDAILADQSWHNLAVFAHGGTNAAVLGWATGVGLAAFGLLDQSTCCLNVIDFDVDESGRLLRKTVRGMNITAYDPVMHRRNAGDMELLAQRLLNRAV
ncbi:MAG: histidine phosphatase family protein [Woeseiaceae bacterium]